jgi:hypothetical protein
MEINLFKVIWFERDFLESTCLPMITVRVDTKWTHAEQYHMRYRAIELTLRWPRPIKFRLDFAQYYPGGYLDPHIDTTQEYEFRVNSILVIRKPRRGGHLYSEKFLYNGKRLKIIQPNLYQHEVTMIEEGERWVLNFQFHVSTNGMEQTPF